MKPEKPLTNLVSRRNALLKIGGAGLGFLAVKATAQLCGVETPPQTAGPFYPKWDSQDQDTDLTQIGGIVESAEGEISLVSGVVLDENCKPIPNAIVEIWQASAEGRYNHELDAQNPVALDPFFQYWGRMTTGKDARYSFKTIKPGAYPASGSWWRPPHIHFKVIAPGFRTLTTQMYWKGDELNDKDSIIQALPPNQRELVIIDFKPSADGSRAGVFDIRLARKPGMLHTPFID